MINVEIKKTKISTYSFPISLLLKHEKLQIYNCFVNFTKMKQLQNLNQILYLIGFQEFGNNNDYESELRTE